MKTKIYLTPEKLVNTDFRQMNIEIRLDDECHNGHDDFTITASIWSKNNFRLESDMGGCCHSEILSVIPDLKIFVDLHLNSSKGVPMYAIENGFYHLKNSPKELFISHLMLNENEYEVFEHCEDKVYFQFLVEMLLLPQRWQLIANQGIEKLEALTGEKYIDSTIKEQFTPLTSEQKADIENKINSGFYLPENVKKRASDKKKADKEALIEKLRNEAIKEKQTIDRELQIKLFVLSQNLPIDNFIFYTHTKTGVFNWNNSSYNSRVTMEQFERFNKSAQSKRQFIEDNIKFECKPV